MTGRCRAPRHGGPAGAEPQAARWRVHLGDPLADMLSRLGRGAHGTRWTACGLHDDPDCPKLSVTAVPALVTCGNCKRARAGESG